MILKVQIDSTGQNMLFYNEDKSVVEQSLVTDEIPVELRAALGSEYPAKIFVHANVTDDCIDMQGVAPWQDW